jgi:predicted tellurium resistance membrane protein TerC
MFEYLLLMMMGFSTWIRGKVLVTVLVAVFLYFVGASVGVVPQPIKDFVSWMNQNTNALLATICFLAACFVLLHWKRKRESDSD